MNEVLFEVSYIGSPNGFFAIIMTLILWTIAWLYLIKRKFTAETKFGFETDRVASIFWGIILLWMLENFIMGYLEIVPKYKSGNYREVEGIVENYEEGIKGDESFTINGVEFEVGRHAAAWGYTLIFTKDSVITGNGQHFGMLSAMSLYSFVCSAAFFLVIEES